MVSELEHNGKKVDQKVNIQYERKGNELRVKVSNVCQKSCFVGKVISKHLLTFEVPAKTDLVVNSAYGNVIVASVKGKGCKVRSSSGDIKISDVNSELDLHSAYGNVMLNKIEGKIDLRSSSGDIVASDLTGELIAKSSYGDQVYKNVNGGMKLATSSGDIKIYNSKGDLHAAVSYGNVLLEEYKGAPSIATATGDIKGKGVVLTGNTSFKTSYGNIKMDIENPLSALSFETRTSYGKIRLSKEGQKVEETNKMLINKGPIKIEAITVSGDQVYE
jgi:DUF4097 and DUF4098 domain-containing protein YvlB